LFRENQSRTENITIIMKVDGGQAISPAELKTIIQACHNIPNMMIPEIRCN
jgi:hypothetical protein